MDVMSETERKNVERPAGTVLPVLIPLALAVIAGVCSTYYFDLNDDSLMKEILSGEYTGTPETRNIQSYYPLSALLAGLYHLFPGADVYGIFLMILQFGCLGAVLVRIGRLCEGKTGFSGEKEKAGRRFRCGAAYILATGMFCSLMLYHLVFLQYSVTVGILAAASAFFFLTMKKPEKEAASARIRMLLPGVIPIWIGFLLRSEMMLFLGPLVGLAFLIRVSGAGNRTDTGSETALSVQKPGETGDGKSLRILSGRRETTVVLLLGIALAVGGMGLAYAVNQAAYSSPEWKQFYELFDARTRLYDFEKLPTWEEDEAFYRSIGLDESEAELIRNYNFGIDDRIDADVLNRIADYAAEKAAGQQSRGQRLRNALWDYRHAFAAEENRPYMLVLTVLYVLALVRVFVDALWCGKSDRTGVPKACCKGIVCGLAGILALFLIRSGLLLYLYYNQRPVDRLTHSLYLVEAVILTWMIFRREAFPERGTSERFCCLCGIILLVSAVIPSLFLQAGKIAEEQSAREEKNVCYDQLKEYAAVHTDQVIFTDVYSTVDFSDKVFEGNDVPVNWDLMGGWASKSPLELTKLQRLGCAAGTAGDADAAEAAGSTSLIMQEALLNLDNCCVAVKEGGSLQWLSDYYRFRGTEIRLVPVEESAAGWDMFRVEAADR